MCLNACVSSGLIHLHTLWGLAFWRQKCTFPQHKISFVCVCVCVSNAVRHCHRGNLRNLYTALYSVTFYKNTPQSLGGGREERGGKLRGQGRCEDGETEEVAKPVRCGKKTRWRKLEKTRPEEVSKVILLAEKTKVKRG